MLGKSNPLRSNLHLGRYAVYIYLFLYSSVIIRAGHAQMRALETSLSVETSSKATCA